MNELIIILWFKVHQMFYILITCFTTIITFIMGYIPYSYPFNDEYGKKTKAAKVFLALTIIAIIGSIFLGRKAYNEDKDNAAFRTRYNKDQVELNKRLANCDTIRTNMKNSFDSIGFSYDETTGRLEKK